eukprot:TRINITY_DN6060_c0_g1_i1.p1 TRINITY_DN6060_c0_g1~~TRINITY_DN6060_c0_g1_i1.p1  ORF type:complete len:548 (-),score=174.45 TRINITY_DN6060_c0_g1_i1:74-1717(-)
MSRIGTTLRKIATWNENRDDSSDAPTSPTISHPVAHQKNPPFFEYLCEMIKTRLPQFPRHGNISKQKEMKARERFNLEESDLIVGLIKGDAIITLRGIHWIPYGRGGDSETGLPPKHFPWSSIEPDVIAITDKGVTFGNKLEIHFLPCDVSKDQRTNLAGFIQDALNFTNIKASIDAKKESQVDQSEMRITIRFPPGYPADFQPLLLSPDRLVKDVIEMIQSHFSLDDDRTKEMGLYIRSDKFWLIPETPLNKYKGLPFLRFIDYRDKNSPDPHGEDDILPDPMVSPRRRPTLAGSAPNSPMTSPRSPQSPVHSPLSSSGKTPGNRSALSPELPSSTILPPGITAGSTAIPPLPSSPPPPRRSVLNPSLSTGEVSRNFQVENRNSLVRSQSDQAQVEIKLKRTQPPVPMKPSPEQLEIAALKAKVEEYQKLLDEGSGLLTSMSQEIENLKDELAVKDEVIEAYKSELESFKLKPVPTVPKVNGDFNLKSTTIAKPPSARLSRPFQSYSVAKTTGEISETVRKAGTLRGKPKKEEISLLDEIDSILGN